MTQPRRPGSKPTQSKSTQSKTTQSKPAQSKHPTAPWIEPTLRAFIRTLWIFFLSGVLFYNTSTNIWNLPPVEALVTAHIWLTLTGPFWMTMLAHLLISVVGRSLWSQIHIEPLCSIREGILCWGLCGLGLILTVPVVPLAAETLIGLVWLMIVFGLALLEEFGR
jgi:hypothetical protein